jgi:hypothetical protein
MMTLAMLIDCSVLTLAHVSPIKPSVSLQNLKSVEKRGKVLRILDKATMAILMMTSIDIFFYCSH